MAETDPRIVKVVYINYRREASVRLIIPHDIFYGSNEWHPTPTWLMNAWDVEKDALRTFAMKDISSWMPLPRHDS